MMTAPTADAKSSKSFVQTEMRAAAMKLHTRDQSKEGKQEAQTPVSKWEPGREEYLQFLVDSRNVYRCFEEIVDQNDVYASFRDSGLERGAALDPQAGNERIERPELARAVEVRRAQSPELVQRARPRLRVVVAAVLAQNLRVPLLEQR